ncbi:MAG TPA: YbjN domain-containing protein, partial [Corynebacterium sp.]|nr:YbjN domain-containing protein [Corynebacterium sp.]
MKDAADSFGFQSLAGADRLLFPWLDHVMTVMIEGGGAARATLRPEALICRTRLRNRVDFARFDALADVVNEWNSQSLSPTMALRLGGGPEDAGAEVLLYSMSLTGPGLSDEQLATVMSLAVETSVLAVSHLVER